MNERHTFTRGGRGATLALGLAGALLLAGCSSGSKSKTPTATQTANPPATSGISLPGTTPAAAVSTPQPTPEVALRPPSATPTETPDDSPLARLVIPKISVNARFVTIGLIAGTNEMDSPKTKDDVGYYDFSPLPTHGGNTLVSGHVDWYTHQTGVFWDLKKLEKGDDIQLVLQDGRTLHYTVTDTELYDADKAPVDEIVGDTPVESLTMITCEGTFDQASAEYNKRRVVRAERVYS
ncbi:MAG TPA: sortase [Dehalococcoidia bacterium]|nr:sortase [Dehalococcoidia bacterium]